MASSKASIAVSSLQEQKEQVIDVVFLCDEWKSSKGGLSTFNREFAINLAETTTSSMKIHCYVSKSDDQDREDARQYGVNLITARSIPGSTDSLERLKFPPPELPNPHLVIGHGRKFGGCAYFLVKATKCQWIQFVHVYCEDLGKYKKSTNAIDLIEENEEKHKMEIELCKAADAVVAVGSRLQQNYSRNLPTVEVEIITPGIFEKFSCELQFAAHRSVKNFHVFLFGRATFEDLSLKGYDIIANAIGSLGKNFKLIFVGSPPGEHEKVEQWFLDNTRINRNQLTIRGYCNNPEELKTMFYQSDLVALPSRTEGFGLVALEAISAGVPVLISGESGIAEALREVEGGNTVIVESDEDVDEWAQRIIETSIESAKEREANAKRLRENYRKVYSWRTECARFRRMIENVMKTANDEELNIKVDAEELKPKEINMQTTTIATESEGCQEVQNQRASAMLPTEGSVSHSGTEERQANRVMSFIAMNYLETMRPKSSEDHNKFMDYMRKMRVIITGVSVGSLVITVKCESLQILEKLWSDYSSGHLGEMVQNCFVTEKILKEFNLTELKLKTTMDIEEYKARKVYFERVALRVALCSQSYFVSSEGHEPHLERWKQKTEVGESEKMEADPLKETLLSCPKLLEALCRSLDKEYKYGLCKYWKHLAEHFCISEQEYQRFEFQPVFSPTELMFEYLQTADPDVTIGCLKDGLRKIERHDVINLLVQHEKCDPLALNDKTLVSSLFDTDPDIIGELAYLLDIQKSGVKKWSDLAPKLNIPRRIFRMFENCTAGNPTEKVFEIVTVQSPKLTIGELINHLKALKRHDVIKAIEKSTKVTESSVIKELVADVEVMEKVCDLLNQINRTTTVSGLRNLGNRLKIKKEILDDLLPSMEVNQSPTEALICRLGGSNPSLTLVDFIWALHEISRPDVIVLLDEYLPAGCVQRLLISSCNCEICQQVLPRQSGGS